MSRCDKCGRNSHTGRFCHFIDLENEVTALRAELAATKGREARLRDACRAAVLEFDRRGLSPWNAREQCAAAITEKPSEGSGRD